VIKRHNEHHGEGHQILSIADGEGKTRWHEEEVEGRNGQKGAGHRRATAKTHGHDEYCEQEQHGDVGEFDRAGQRRRQSR
jgi:hypothetical protein